MPNLVVALKDEIRRLARKEVKSMTGATAQSVARFRREIATLKREINAAQKKIVFLEGQERKRISSPNAAVVSGDGNDVRFSARSVKAQRRRTGLSAADYAKLVGVTPLTIYNWENGKSRPRLAQLETLVALRGIGKREALAKLEIVKNSEAPKRKTKRTPK
ncbi:MAG: helix-turn-helix transcriptional regulator [Pirellulales bacterium]|nr:helix-turn-helix transcriptional regulator [Pirellulales bacterium]